MTASLPQPRRLGRINWIGLATLTRKEIERFMIVSAQTVIAPVISTLLFYLVFSLALGGGMRDIDGISHMAFLTPGLIMMSMAQNAFANTSSSLVISKVQGNIVDVLMPPLSTLELAIGYTLGGIVRGLAVGAVSVAVLAFLAPMAFAHPAYVVFHAVMGSMMLALLGLIGGIWASKFDHLATITNFIIMPATFLSGTFYAAHELPPFWQGLAHINPFFYMIDGFRYGLAGVASSDLSTGIIVMIAVNAALWLVCLQMLRTGYKLKS